jgi:uncharacterized membrane protein YbaN (DUF454 family)
LAQHAAAIERARHLHAELVLRKGYRPDVERHSALDVNDSPTPAGVERRDAGGAAPPPGGSRLARAVFLMLGTLFVALGVIGLVVPVLPTTPFLLLAAACYARGSQRCYDRLLANPTFGPLIREWREHRSIPWRTKISAIALMSVTLAASIVFFVEPAWLKALLATLGVALALWLASIPSRDRPRRGRSLLR